jgi:hypothetical protein
VSAATTAALAAYLSGLSAPSTTLTHLSLLFSCPDYTHLVGQNPGCFVNANQQLWGPVLRVLREALEVSQGQGQAQGHSTAHGCCSWLRSHSAPCTWRHNATQRHISISAANRLTPGRPHTPPPVPSSM